MGFMDELKKLAKPYTEDEDDFDEFDDDVRPTRASRSNSSDSSEFEEFFFIKNSVFSAFENRDTRFLSPF